MKKIIELEYSFKSVSSTALWNGITSPIKLGEWFAEKVEAQGNQYTFYWDKMPHIAKVLSCKENVLIKFHWENSQSNDYFMFQIRENELTGEITLEVTDTCDISDYDTTINLWDSQIETLRRKLGV